MPTSVPARVDRNAFFLQWSEKMAQLEAIKEERKFLEFLTNALADVLEMDIGLCVELFETTGLVNAPDVGYRIIYLNDSKGVLAKEHPEIEDGFEIQRSSTHPYFNGVWGIKMNTFAEPIPGLGIDFYLPMRTKTVMDVGTFASPIILLDDSEVAVNLEAVTNTIRAETMRVRRLYDATCDKEGV